MIKLSEIDDAIKKEKDKGSSAKEKSLHHSKEEVIEETPKADENIPKTENNFHADEEPQSSDPKDEKIAELTDMLKRLQAEFENYRKRNEKECQNIVKTASRDLVASLLPILDNFELALLHAKDSDEKKGFELIYAQLLDILQSEGLEKIDVTGKKFDPYTMEAVMQEKSDKPDMVLEEFQPGYCICGQIIRHAKVKVGK